MYATFGDKQTLFLTGLRRYVEQIGAPSKAALSLPEATLHDKVQGGFDTIIARMADPANPPGCLLAQTAAESGALEPRAREVVQSIIEEQVVQMRELLLEHLSPADVDEAHSLASYLVTVAQAIAVMHRAGTPIDELRRTAQHAVSVLDARATTSV